MVLPLAFCIVETSIMGSQIIYVKGLGGLGNRLYTLNAAADLAVKHGLDLHVDWNDGHLLRPGEDAFVDYLTLELPGLRVTSGNRPEWRAGSPFLQADNWREYMGYRPPSRWKAVQVLTSRLPGRWSRWHQAFYLLNTADSRRMAPWSNEFLEKGGKLRPADFGPVIPYIDFIPNSNSDQIPHRFSLRSPRLDRVHSFIAKHHLAQRGIGIHVRSSDKQPTRSLATLRQHIESVAQPDSVLFLATDNAATLAEVRKWPWEMISLAPESVHAPDAAAGIHNLHVLSGNYDGVEAIYESSLFDMWALSMCKVLIYQGNSSFSGFSHYLRGGKGLSIDWLK